ncbi:AbrB family transcriptional regulator [Pseudooceanicola sp. C21-150M6]|uniref:AbrB family transcriptional regulator n=1 Tax=Pseudooceanicola sp. C21-150M6 TaxID=3434355 RepID=UPI003D7F79CD
MIHLALIALGTLGGTVAKLLGLPLPYIIGSLLAVAIYVQTCEALGARAARISLPDGFKFNEKFRALFIAVVGMAIGSQVTWEVILGIPAAIPSFIGLTLFVPAAFWMNYQIFHRIGGYDRATAFYSGSPGGLYESIAFGEMYGADMRLLMLAQFLRIIIVVTLLPIGLSFHVGHPVGSSGGMSFSPQGVGIEHIPFAILTAMTGLFLGVRLKFPAPQLVGPLVAGAVVSVLGLANLDMPAWVINAAQLVIGTTLGTRFSGIRPGMLVRGAGLGLLSVGAMLVLGGLMAIVLIPLTGETFDVLLISFAPGGVTEMALVALSLNANPAFVTMHHLYRIILTVVVIVRMSARQGKS